MDNRYPNDKTNKLRYIAYVRKSTEDEEKQVLSKEAQRNKIDDCFKDLNIVDVLDESKSAFEPDKRDEFKKMLEMVDSSEIDGIIAWHPDRLSRNEVDASAITWRIRQGKIKDLKFASFSFDNSPEGIMMLQMTMSQSQYSSAKLSKDVKRGNEQKRKNGGICGVAMEGYLNDRLNKTIYPDELRFPLLRQAFDMFLTGEHSVQKVLRFLNDDCKYLTVKRNKRGGESLSRTSLYYIFTNPRYSGWIPDPYDPDLFHKAGYKPMLTTEEYDKVQMLLGKKGRPRLATNKQFALRGLVRCGECGCAITAEEKIKHYKNGTSKTYIYYHCTHKRRPCSEKAYMTQDKLYEEVSKLLDRYELNPKLYEWGMEAIREMAEKEVAERTDAQAMQNHTIDDVQQQLDRLLDMATRSMIDDKQFEAKSAKLKKKLKDIQSQQAQTSDRVNNWYDHAANMLKQFTQANDNFVSGDFVSKKDILLAIGTNPLLKGGKVYITSNDWVIPIERVAKQMRVDIDTALTQPQQIQNTLLEGLRQKWYARRDSNPRLSVPKTDALIR
jgi:site-specific DNA recombinase